jgi:hypothetical protein
MLASAISTKNELTFPTKAVWPQKDPEVKAVLRRSAFYIICGRAEAK